jgi:large subunit ribosomal protein L21
MFAVLKTGGKQYRVQAGDVLRDRAAGRRGGRDRPVQRVLMVGGDSPVVGVPLVADAGVQATVIDQIKGDKVIHYVKRRRKHSSQRTKGHRQKLTLVRITEILASGADKTGVKAAIGTGKPRPTRRRRGPRPKPRRRAKKAAPEEGRAEGRRRLRQEGQSRRSQGPRPRRNRRNAPRRSPRPKRRSNPPWHTRKQAVRPATAAIRPAGAWA